MKKKRFVVGDQLYEQDSDGGTYVVKRVDTRIGGSSSDARARMIERQNSEDRSLPKNAYQRELDRRRAAGELFPD